MDEAKQQLIDKLKTANNVLVTVSRDPSVDQLAALLGLTLVLNKQGKHAAAVFSGQVPSTLEFLQPEETIEKNTDSLRDFIIALDKSKADKLRYKVEDNVVRIFITPYKTSISQADLEFSEGDFNVDLVVGLGVRQQEDLDEAITAHGRILHDATVASINTAADGGLGSIIWSDTQASSLSELVAELAQTFGDNVLDQQIATSLLTGIVSETDRFSNDKTSSQTMSVSADLMAAGANQQLVASKLEEEQVVPLSTEPISDYVPLDKEDEDGTLRIDHVEDNEAATADTEAPEKSEDESPKSPKISPYADRGLLPTAGSPESALLAEDEDGEKPSGAPPAGLGGGSRLMTEPPTLGGTLTANSNEEGLEPTSDPLSMPSAEPPQLLDRKPNIPPSPTSPPFSSPTPSAPAPAPTPAPAQPAPPTPIFTPDPNVPVPDWITTAIPTLPPATSSVMPPQPTPTPPSAPAPAPTPPPPPPPPRSDGARTLSDLEQSVSSPHVELNSARDEVDKALAGAAADNTLPEPPIEALNAQPLGGALHDNSQTPPTPTPPPSNPPTPASDTSAAPPPVPPPIPFQFGNPSPPQNPPQ